VTYNQFEIIGLDDYENIVDRFYSLIDQVFGYKDLFYLQAVEEAVCNAGRYSVYGPEKAQILILMRVAAYDIAVTVISKTHPFDALGYQKKLRSLANSKYADMDWGEYVGLTTASSGFWYMLTGVDYLYIDSDGQSITLSKNRMRRAAEKNVSKKISVLAPRFLVKENGVII